MATATATGVATYSALSTVEGRTFYELKLLEVATPNFLHVWFGQQGFIFPVTTLPENTGDTIQWNKPTAFTAVTTALTENVVPAGEDLTIATTTATVSSYGSYVKYTKKLAELGIHKVAAIAADLLGRQAGDSLDQITRAVLIASGTAQYVNGRAGRTTLVAGDYISAAEVMEAVATLQAANARPVMDGKFPAIIHPKTQYDLMNDPVIQSFIINSNKAGDQFITGWIGDVLGVSFYMSSNAYSVASTYVTAYLTMIFGKDSFGIGGLAAYMPSAMNESKNGNNTAVEVRPLQLIPHDFGEIGEDPFNLTATLAWYTTYVTKVLDATMYIRLEHDNSLD